ncbi:hypothetical protein ABB37_07557 [Leptomonas pyrrhocoris]|uniref:Uncharacterized protein n=1 Tax=Leptomonas pyrrhocoris TaxID=157538 RepID=A0A0M9FV60_LEPPY|nr:hypothetical protein ABB37_07557 [Leptomonas pyrrhocoris]KPA76725.1 hypothetical protein ABB37_07557 [Leptomonas pyrrhocoris]|eukprot:XP_015655164.1 hypothetical protein ABB37_07557 [Leptomonas pyrrhocoris]
MSLFDDDGSLSPSNSASSSDVDEGTLPLRAPPVPLSRSAGAAASSFDVPVNGNNKYNNNSGGGGGAPLTVLEQRRRMVEADEAGRLFGGRGTAPWRSALMGPPPASSTPGETSKFGSSIAAAMNLRREEKEKTLLRRLQQQRRAEDENGEGNALAQTDLEVGVFVTASYKAMLQRNIRPVAKGAHRTDTDDQLAQRGNADSEDAQEEDDSDPLSAYLRQLEHRRHASTIVPAKAAAGDYYDQIMKAPLREEKNDREGNVAKQHEVSSAVRAAENDSSDLSSDPTRVAPPTLAELQDLVGAAAAPSAAPTSSSSYAQPEDALRSSASAVSSVATNEQSQPSVVDAEREEHSAVLAHARLVYDTREARRRRTGTDATVQACARRCDDRIASALFCSLK